jgi:hypothetical protein
MSKRDVIWVKSDVFWKDIPKNDGKDGAELIGFWPNNAGVISAGSGD